MESYLTFIITIINNINSTRNIRQARSSVGEHCSRIVRQDGFCVSNVSMHFLLVGKAPLGQRGDYTVTREWLIRVVIAISSRCNTGIHSCASRLAFIASTVSTFNAWVPSIMLLFLSFFQGETIYGRGTNRPNPRSQ